MEFSKEEQEALIKGRSGQAEGIWIINPGGRIVACALEVYSGKNAMGNPKGRKFDYGYRVATPEEVAKELQTTIDANKKASEKDVVLTKIVNDESVAQGNIDLSWAEIKKLAKEKGIKSYGKKKEELMQELGLV